VLAGSLPPGVPANFYAEITRELRARFGAAAPKVAIDSSGAPLAAAVAARPDLLKPNAEELAELTGVSDPDSLEADPRLAARAALTLIEAGVGAVLATLGSQGAVLVTADGCWLARSPKIVARSTVGAGDSSLAGYLLSDIAGASAPDCLRQAAAHGAAAASLPGSTVPSLNQTNPGAVTVTVLPTHPKEDDQ
jgi:1-phosphofructokinase